MLPTMYDLPDRDNTGVTYVVNGEDIVDGATLSDLTQRKAKESA